jgi:glutamine amidotransferase
VIAIIEYGSGNVGAISNVYRRLRVEHVITSDHSTLQQADRYILPGVGAFDTTMKHLTAAGLVELLRVEVVERQKKVLGICVGMQILADRSDEGELPGLGWIPGEVRRIDESKLVSRPKLPHMGWNSVSFDKEARLFGGVNTDRGFYFLHSYHFIPSNPSHITGVVQYGAPLVCSLQRGNVYAVQFHPEKSHDNGVAVFRNFAEV